MRSKILIALFACLLLMFVVASINSIQAAPPSSGPITRSIASGGSASLTSGPTGGDVLQWPEFVGAESNEPGPAPFNGTITNRSNSHGSKKGASASSSKKAKSNPELNTSFDGLNHRNQRLANGGNQFSLEPPDQGLCVGNGFVLETVNDVLRVYDTSGNPLTGVIDQNTFYSYPPAINRSTFTFGPFVTDPSCLYDTDVKRWFHVVLTLDVDPTTGAFTGKNHLDLAVSNTPDPTGTWTIYRIPVQNDGTQGTPNHHCGGGPCIGDYPHIGADENGFYITTNEYDFFGPAFQSANVYAFSKSQLAATPANITVTQFDTVGADNGNPGFTLWPSVSAGGQHDSANGGTEYFLSSNAAEEANGSGSSTDLLVWRLTNTSSLNSNSPSLSLNHSVLQVGQYGIPPKANQKPGDFPLGQCLNDVPCATFLNGEPDPFAPEVISHLDSNDTRMQQVYYANGKLWGALDTAVTIGNENKAGIEYFIVNPHSKGGAGKLDMSGYLALAGNNLTYPAVAVTGSGRGVIAFTVVGNDYYPSAGYAGLDAKAGAGEIHIAAAGLGVSDGFTSYKYYVGDPPRTRWG